MCKSYLQLLYGSYINSNSELFIHNKSTWGLLHKTFYRRKLWLKLKTRVSTILPLTLTQEKTQVKNNLSFLRLRVLCNRPLKLVSSSQFLRRVPTWYLLLHTITFIQFHILRLQMGSTTFNGIPAIMFTDMLYSLKNPRVNNSLQAME